LSGQRDPGPAALPQARTKRSRLSLIWLIPLVAVAIGGYLAWHTLSQRGPIITITFQTADGITADQTQVRHKAVTLGTVAGVRLAHDMSHVVVSVRMGNDATPYLTNQARFWVVRPRLTAGSVSGLETLVSGAYIEMDPGTSRGPPARGFTGLEQPPGVRSDEPGDTYTLVANRLGSLGPGSPVFYRDLNVGEVLSYDIGDGSGPVRIRVFVRAPFNQYVQKETHFWNVSGLSVNLGPEGVHVQIASVQAVLSGGVGFDAPEGAKGEAAPAGSSFPLYEDYAKAQNAGFKDKVPFEAFFTSSVRGLGIGSAVEFLGIQVGTVSSVDLDFDAPTGKARVRVRFDVEPERVGQIVQGGTNSPRAVAQRLVAHGLRAQLSSANFLTGQLLVSLDFTANPMPAALTMDGNTIVLPSTNGGLDSLLASASDIAQKFDRLPLDELGANLNATLRSANGALSGVEQLARTTNQGLAPTLRRLPEITTELEGTLTGANRFLTQADRSYGGDSHLAQELDRAMTELGDTARSIRQFADFLDRHPEALIRGRTEYGAGR
jgi:paraquat-inducible protein B